MSQNLSNIPGIAIGRTEVLKDGAAVIYGADAVGGVVNFITREGFTGFEARGNFTHIDGSDGDFDMGFIAGWGEGDTNFFVSGEWEHRSRLETEERDFASLPYWENPTPWSYLTNLSRYLPLSAIDIPAFGISAGSPIGSLYDFDQASCETQGGIFSTGELTSGDACYYNYWSYYNLVEDQDIFRGYAQLDTVINENMNFHIDASYGQVQVPEQFASPSLPTLQGPGTTTGATYQYIVPTDNPFVAEFAARTGWDQSALYGLTREYSILLLRPFAHNGNPVGGNGEGFGNAASIDNQVWRVSSGIDGTLGDFFGRFSDIGYDVGLTYNQSISAYSDPDYIGYRLQEALNGFGGPNCNAEDLDLDTLGTQNPAAAGVGDCVYYNPFSTSYAQQPELGLTNPNYIAGYENSDELVAWLFNDRYQETVISSITFDAVFDGLLPVELPGGQIGWALGTQLRSIESRETIPDPLFNGSTPCAWPSGQRPLPNDHPDFNGCTLNEPGPFGYYGTDTNDYYDQQSTSLFLETNWPVTDDINVQAAVRREEFSGGLGSTVYKVAGRWQVLDQLAFRGSFGTNFQAPAITLSPGSITNVVRSYEVVNNAWLGAQQVTRDDITPEEAETANIGIIWQSQGFQPDHHLTVILDYFDIHTMGEIGELATPDQIATAVFTSSDICNHPLIGRVQLNDTATSPGGQCTANTVAGDMNLVVTDIGNGSDQITKGFDFQVDYEFPLGGADVSLGLAGTRVTELTTSARMLDGFEVAPEDDRLGDLNFSSIANAGPEWRINGHLNYNRGAHNLRLTGRYVSGLTDERGGIDPNGYYPGGTDTIDFIDNAVDIDSYLTFDATYVYDLNENFRITGTMANIFNEDPPFTRMEFGYDPRIADALGRTIEVGFKYTY